MVLQETAVPSPRRGDQEIDEKHSTGYAVLRLRRAAATPVATCRSPFGAKTGGTYLNYLQICRTIANETAPAGPRSVATGEAQRNPWINLRNSDPAPAGQRND